MSHFEPVRPEHASRLINHGPTVLVTSAHGDQRNVMAAAWSMPVEFTPPRIAVVIDKKTFTWELVRASGLLGICIPGAALMDACYAAGTLSGREGDKFARLGLAAAAGPALGVPVIEQGCAAWMECRLIDGPELAHVHAAYDSCFVEVVSARADARVFSAGRWSFSEDNAALHTIHHLGAGNFVCAGNAVQARTLA